MEPHAEMDLPQEDRSPPFEGPLAQENLHGLFPEGQGLRGEIPGEQGGVQGGAVNEKERTEAGGDIPVRASLFPPGEKGKEHKRKTAPMTRIPEGLMKRQKAARTMPAAVRTVERAGAPRATKAAARAATAPSAVSTSPQQVGQG